MSKLFDNLSKNVVAATVIILSATVTWGITVVIAIISHYDGLYDVKVNTTGIQLTLDSRKLESEPE